ncbi:uncharacterized protein LAESUDRAFT_735299 [Laetiporus sulphureus 93-53]|uniref:MARVEL domain-containing protein n=1 Tax=Laetiporus sulphureus 93-53 TaxID=1314785 RepID=A0A165FZU8_9APHY|nr:uncharacterized protein LAESUDRAFT_735299 [Laetiporus sulphureus 93-53]KZT09638.1 hypothetical protein LAESUDRAFT_735299 [Laetiporus sulphureus 93-53]
MVSNYSLDTPPPPSRFRRPWSPDPSDPFPKISRPAYNDFGTTAFGIQRQVSDDSIVALDLAEYAAALNRNADSSNSREFRPYDPYPPTPPSLRPFASLASLPAGSPSSSDLSPRTPTSQPFSLPPPSLPQKTLQSNPSFSSRTHALHEAQSEPNSDSSDVDLVHFPSFTRPWFNQGKPQKSFSLPAATPIGHGFNTKLSPFDPAFPTHVFDIGPFPNPYAYTAPPSYPADSSHDLGVLPWNADSDASVHPNLKEERMRMLEAEFGGKELPPVVGEKVGSVDANGRLITEGPKTRMLVRGLQMLFVVAACLSTVYTALLIKTTSTPPPAHKLPAYVLYVCSFLTALALLYLFLIYPYCCGRRKPPRDATFEGSGGLMVLPVQHLPGGKKNKRKGKKHKGVPHDDGVQVNLIVDPTMFGGGRDRDTEWDDGEDDGTDFGPPGSYVQARRPRRRGIFAGLALEAEWKRARKQLKVRMAFDIITGVIWGAVFVIIMMGKRCPVGGYNGWCDGYNVGTAAAFLLFLSFGFSIYYDIKDLHASRTSPRNRP